MQAIARGKHLLAQHELPVGVMRMWLGQVRHELRRIYGPDSEAERLWPVAPESFSREQAREVLRSQLPKAEEFVRSISESARRSFSGSQQQRIFLGHGRSPAWREVKDFLQERLCLATEEFNRESVPGIATTERLQRMLDASTFAFLIMTAEDEHADQTRHARANVIHEIGLFQGRLGNRRAIILLEDGCEQFSNVHGLSHIPFPPRRIGAAFEEIRRVLEREGLIET